MQRKFVDRMTGRTRSAIHFLLVPGTGRLSVRQGTHHLKISIPIDVTTRSHVRCLAGRCQRLLSPRRYEVLNWRQRPRCIPSDLSR